jgi:hypothetical protein
MSENPYFVYVHVQSMVHDLKSMTANLTRSRLKYHGNSRSLEVRNCLPGPAAVEAGVSMRLNGSTDRLKRRHLLSECPREVNCDYDCVEVNIPLRPGALCLQEVTHSDGEPPRKLVCTDGLFAGKVDSAEKSSCGSHTLQYPHSFLKKVPSGVPSFHDTVRVGNGASVMLDHNVQQSTFAHGHGEDLQQRDESVSLVSFVPGSRSSPFRKSVSIIDGTVSEYHVMYSSLLLTHVEVDL